jgi:hypothetical protein
MMRDSRGYLVKLSKHSRLICRLNHLLVAGSDKGVYRGQRRRQTHLEACPGRNQPGLFQLRKHVVRCPGCIRVALPLKGYLAGRQRRAQLEARQRGVGNGIGRDFLKVRIDPDEASLPSNPVGPLAGLTVGNTPQPPTEDRTGGAKNVFGISQGNTADKMDTTRLMSSRAW